MTTATELRRQLIESGPYSDLAQAAAIENTLRTSHGVQGYHSDLDGAIWPNPLSIYWATSPYHQHRPPITGENTMTDKKTKPEADTTPEAGPFDTDQSEKGNSLFTGWANSTQHEDFNHDQAAVHEWMEASDQLRLEALETAMTLADAEELIATAKKVASEHSRRAERARNLVMIVAARLGREVKTLEAAETKKAVPVANPALANRPEGAREPVPTKTRAMPVASSPSNLPSAL